MKKPRDILLSHHEHRERDLERVTATVLEALDTQNSKPKQAFFEFTTEMIVDFFKVRKGFWEAVAMVWALIGVLQFVPSDSEHPSARPTQVSSFPSSIVLDLLHEQQQMKNELLGMENYVMAENKPKEKPPIVPGPQSKKQTHMESVLT